MTVQYMIPAAAALAAGTAKTVIEVATGANSPLEWIAVDITFDGVSGTAVPVRVDFCSYTASGTGTSTTPKRLGQAVGTSSATVKTNDTVEPAGATVLFSWYVPPTSGIAYQWPMGREFFQNTSTFYGIRLTAPAAVNALVNLSIEE